MNDQEKTAISHKEFWKPVAWFW